MSIEELDARLDILFAIVRNLNDLSKLSTEQVTLLFELYKDLEKRIKKLESKEED